MNVQKNIFFFAFRSPEQLLKEFDGSQMCFNPPVPPPKKNAKPSKYIGQHIFVDSEFGDYCEKIMNEPIEKKSIVLQI